MLSKGYIALTHQPLTRERIAQCVAHWLERFERLEQVAPMVGNHATTLSVHKPGDLMWEPHLQFRILNGADFAWVYISVDSRVIETSGMPAEEISLCLDVLTELPDIAEIIDQRNERRLDELETQGLL